MQSAIQQYFSYRQAAEYLGCSYPQVKRLVAQGIFDVTVFGTMKRISRASIDNYAKRNTFVSSMAKVA